MLSRINRGDVWGGISAAAVILPQATAFGIALWAPYQVDLAHAAMAGLVTALCLCLFSGLSGGTTGMVSSPTGPTMVLLAGALVTLNNRGYEGESLFLMTALLLFLSGLFQIIIGLSRGGRLIKFIPYPVVAGFMSGSALLMIVSQVQLLEIEHFRSILDESLWIPWFSALFTFFAIILAPRLLPAVPGTVSGLIFGSMAFHLLCQVTGTTYPANWVVGHLPGIDDLQLEIPSTIQDIPWNILLPASLALSVLSSLDSLLTSVVADVASNRRHNARRELTGQGIGQMLAAVLGGTAGAGTTGATLAAIHSGGGRWTALFAALIFALVIMLLGPVAELLPVSVLAGIILHVAIVGMIERDMLHWFRNPRSRVDAITAILVTAVTVTYDLMIAVGVGLLIAIAHFVRAQILAPVVHRRSTIAQHPSLRRRKRKHRRLLEKHADEILIYELKGNLFFGTIEKLFEEFNQELNRPVQIILDMARVQQVDLTAVKMLQQMAERLHQASGELIFTNVRKGKGLGKKVDKTLRQISPHHSGDYPVRTFIDADEAIEYAENRLLTQLGKKLKFDQRIELRDSDLCQGLPEDVLQVIESLMKPVRLNSGDALFRRGDRAAELFVVIQGEIDIQLPYSTHHYKRLAKFGPGSFFGEVVFLKPGPRTADAIAIKQSELLMMDGKGFRKLQETHPQAAIKLIMRLSRELSDRLRWSDSELRRLSD